MIDDGMVWVIFVNIKQEYTHYFLLLWFMVQQSLKEQEHL